MKKKLQARAIVIRQVTPEYYCPLGVWVVREAARKATNKELCFESMDLLKQCLQVINPCHFLLKHSELYKKFNTQKMLTYYL
jgi:hypothetical protein